jgi:cell division transport system permease protein
MMSNLRRTPYQTFAAVLVLFFSLFLIGAIVATVSFLYGLLHYIETRPQVTVYFQSAAEESDIFAVRDELIASGKVASVKYVSKKEAYNIYRELTKDNPLLLEMTSEDILPASLEIFAKQPGYLPQIAESLKNRQGVDEVQFQKVIVDRLLALTGGVRNAMLVLFAYLVLMATIVIAATSSFKIALRKDEIEIQQLLGASNFYVVKPYLKEGLFLGVLSSILAMGALGVAVVVGGPTLNSYLSGIPAIDIALGPVPVRVWPLNPTLFAGVFAVITTFGVLIGVFANLLAARKYLS